MAPDPELVIRLRAWFAAQGIDDERRMFGGAGYFTGGHMVAVASFRDGTLMVRCAKDQTDELADSDGVNPTVMRGRPMRGWLDLETRIVESDADLDRWLSAALAHVRTLPPKQGPPK